MSRFDIVFPQAIAPLGFTTENLKKVIQGQKWETRRINPRDKTGWYWLQEPTKVTHLESNLVECYYPSDESTVKIHLTDKEVEKLLRRKTSRIQPGRFQYKSTARFCVNVSKIHEEFLHEITLSSIKAEGISSGKSEDFQELWDSIYAQIPGASWDENPKIYVITISEVVKK